MALDEPKEDDEIIECGSYKLVLDEQIRSLIEQAGPVEVDFVDTPTQKGYMVRVGKPDGEEGCCGSDGGECGSDCG